MTIMIMYSYIDTNTVWLHYYYKLLIELIVFIVFNDLTVTRKPYLS